jgi:serine/threonine protein kinase
MEMAVEQIKTIGSGKACRVCDPARVLGQAIRKVAPNSPRGTMIGNALIGALERAVEQTKATVSNDEIDSEVLSKHLATELNGLTTPTDPARSLPALEFWLRATVANVTFDRSELDRLKQFYQLLVRAGASTEVEGAIGFLLCCRSADRAQALKTGRNAVASSETAQAVAAALADASQFLVNPAVRSWIASYYAIDKSKLLDEKADASMLASGTTSYVIRYHGSADFVLKLVKPQFMGSPHIQEQTSSYGSMLKAQAAGNTLLPRVLSNGSSYIQMEFIEGKSFADLMESGDLDAMTIEERRELLFGILGNLEALRSPHLDLSPGNIMVEGLSIGRDKNRRFKVRLIDFGYNYLLREGMSGLPIRSDIVRYSAPEMMAGSYEGSIKADLYSLGAIILDVMRSSPNAVDLSVQLDRCWQAHPQLAAIVEELVAKDPVDRARWSNGLDQPGTYRALRRRLEQEERITKLIEARVDIGDAWSGKDGPVRELLRIVRELPSLRQLDEADTYSADARYLYWWSLLINAFLVASLAVCGYMLVQTLGLGDIVPVDKWSPLGWIKGVFEKIKSIMFGSAEAQAVLAGQALALTIILVVAQYYNSIFSSIKTWSIRSPWARTAEVTMRSTPFGIMVVCVSTSTLFPTWWYVTSLMGPLITAANNLAVLRFCEGVRQETAGGRSWVIWRQQT